MGECDRCGRGAYLTELFDQDGRRLGAYGRECLHVIVRGRAEWGGKSFRVAGRRIWSRPGGRGPRRRA